MIITSIDIETQRFLHSINVNKKTIKTGNINSAKDNPNQPILKALPLFFSKKRDMVVVAVWLDKPCPAKRIKKIPTNKKITDEIFENIKQLDESLILWRSTSQWIGGIYFLFSILLLIDIFDKNLKQSFTEYLSFNYNEIFKQSLKIIT